MKFGVLFLFESFHENNSIINGNKMIDFNADTKLSVILHCIYMYIHVYTCTFNFHYIVPTRNDTIMFQVEQGPVVQNFFSLTSSFRPQLVK